MFFKRLSIMYKFCLSFLISIQYIENMNVANEFILTDLPNDIIIKIGSYLFNDNVPTNNNTAEHHATLHELGIDLYKFNSFKIANKKTYQLLQNTSNEFKKMYPWSKITIHPFVFFNYCFDNNLLNKDLFSNLIFDQYTFVKNIPIKLSFFAKLFKCKFQETYTCQETLMMNFTLRATKNHLFLEVTVQVRTIDYHSPLQTLLCSTKLMEKDKISMLAQYTSSPTPLDYILKYTDNNNMGYGSFWAASKNVNMPTNSNNFGKFYSLNQKFILKIISVPFVLLAKCVNQHIANNAQ